MSEFRTLSVESLLRRVAAARAAGDVRRAQAEWDACVIRATARVRTAVHAFRTVNGDRVAPEDRDEVVNDALERACRLMIETLQQLEARSFLAAMGTCAEHACRDHFRRLGAYRKGLAGPPDAPHHEHELARAADLERVDRDAALEAADRVHRALGRMSNEQWRRALGMKELGVPYEEIAERLDVSVPNAYQLVSRGMRDLARLLEP